MIDGWLLETIIRITANYTQPGHRVLLLAPPTQSVKVAADPSTRWKARSGRGLIVGLIEAAGAVARSGRTVAAHTATTLPALVDPPIGRHRRAGQSAAPESAGDRSPAGGRAATVGDPDLFDAVIITVDPDAAEWANAIAWDRLTTPHGILAVITHSDHAQGRLRDPSEQFVRAVRGCGLTWLDRIVLLEVPVREGVLVVDLPAWATPPLHATPGTSTPRHARVHSDLLLFTRSQPDPSDGQGEAG